MIPVICDLDGVIYLGRTALPGSAAALRRLRQTGHRVVFATNNSTRTAEDAAAKITGITGLDVDPADVFTSAEAAATTLDQGDSPVMVVGEDGIVQALKNRGLSMTEQAVDARSVVVGLYRDVTYDVIAEAAEAVRSGARFVATNTDGTYPTSDGLKPGSGAIVAAIAAVAERDPEVCGKPHPPMRDLIKSRGIGDRAWVIGDRVDTDIALASTEPDWSSILVLTGVTGPQDPIGEADHVVADFEAAVDVVLASTEQR